MNIQKQLLYEHSKANAELIVQYIGKDQARFDELFSLFIKNEEVVSQRAAYSLDHCLNNNPNMILPYLNQVVDNLTVPNQHDAVIRASIRAMQFVEIPEYLQGKTFDICLNFITSEKQPVAIRAFSITVAYNIAKQYPELLSELFCIIEKFPNHESPGLRNRSQKIIDKIKKQLV